MLSSEGRAAAPGARGCMPGTLPRLHHPPGAASDISSGCAVATRSRRRRADACHVVLQLPASHPSKFLTIVCGAASSPAAPAVPSNPEPQAQRRFQGSIPWPPDGLSRFSASSGSHHSRPGSPVEQPQPWTPGTRANDASILASASKCKSWQDVAALYNALLDLEQCLEPGTTARTSKRSVHSGGYKGYASKLPKQHSFQIRPRHAAILLARLAWLYPKLWVRASVVLQGAPAAAFPPSSSPATTNQRSSSATGRLGSPSQSLYGHNSSDSQTAGVDQLSEWGVGTMLLPSPGQGASTSSDGSDEDWLSPDRFEIDAAEVESRSGSQGQNADPLDPTLDKQLGLQALLQSVELLADDLAHAIAAQPNSLSQLQEVELCEVLSALARLQYSRTALAAHVCMHLGGSRSLAQLSSSPRALAHTAWAVAKLGIDPGPAWIARYLQVSSQVISEFGAVDCAAVLWALGKWSFRPADAWLQSMYSQLRLVSAELGPQGVTNVAWGLAILKAEPPRVIVELIMIETQVVLKKMSFAGLATVCWSLAIMHQQPPAFWVDVVLGELAHKFPTVPKSSRGLPFANVVWALSCWQTVKPNPGWFTRYCRHAAKCIPSMNTRSLAVVLQGLADLGHTPERAWVNFALEEFHKRAGDACPTSLVAVLWAVSRMLQRRTGGVKDEASKPGQTTHPGRPSRAWLVRYAHILQDLAERCSAVFAQLTPGELVDVLVSLSDMGYHPGTPWLTKHAAFCNACITEFSPYQMRLMATAMKTMQGLKTSQSEPLPRRGHLV